MPPAEPCQAGKRTLRRDNRFQRGTRSDRFGGRHNLSGRSPRQSPHPGSGRPGRHRGDAALMTALQRNRHPASQYATRTRRPGSNTLPPEGPPSLLVITFLMPDRRSARVTDRMSSGSTTSSSDPGRAWKRSPENPSAIARVARTPDPEPRLSKRQPSIGEISRSGLNRLLELGGGEEFVSPGVGPTTSWSQGRAAPVATIPHAPLSLCSPLGLKDFLLSNVCLRSLRGRALILVQQTNFSRSRRPPPQSSDDKRPIEVGRHLNSTRNDTPSARGVNRTS